MSIKYEVHQDKKTGECSLHAFDVIRQGEVISWLRLPTIAGPDKYSIEVEPGIHLNCRDHAVGFTNHSCNPNAAIRKGRLVAFACIKPGDEITIDYTLTESKLANPFDCNCGSKNCKGRIE